MTVPVSLRRAGPFTGNGTATSWPFSFKVFTTADIQVILNASGIESTLVLDSDYSVTLNPDQVNAPGGTITYPLSGSPITSDSTVSIIGAVEYDQPTDLPAGGNFSPAALESALDYLSIQIQQLREITNRQLGLSASTAADVSGSLPAPQADKFLAWNSTATKLRNVDSATLASIVAFGTAVSDIFTGDGSTKDFPLSADPASLGNLDVSVNGSTKLPGVDFTWSGTVLSFTAAPANASKILARYQQGLPQGLIGTGVVTDANVAAGARVSAAKLATTAAVTGGVERTLAAVFGEWISAEALGAVGDGTTDDSDNLVNAANNARAAGFRELRLTKPAYKIAKQCTFPSHVTIRGNGRTVLDVSTVAPGVGKAALISEYSSWADNADRWPFFVPFADLILKGHASPADGVYTANLYGIEIRSYHQILSRVAFVGFDRGTVFAPSVTGGGWLAWESKFYDCLWSYCNTGMVADFSAAGGGAGAGVTVRGGGFTHCVNSINMNAVEMTWLDVYSDSAINQHCSGLVTKLGGTEFGFWHVTNSRFEGGGAAGVPWMDLNGRAVFRDCFWVGRSGSEKVMALGSDASVVVEGGTDRSSGNQIRASGSGSLTVFGVRPINDNEASTWTSGTGGFLNGDAGTGTTDGWAVQSGAGVLTNVYAGNFKHSGKAFQVVGASTVIASAPVWLDPSYNQFNVVFRASNANASAVVVTLRQYNITGYQVATATVNIPAGAAGTLLNITGTRYGNACYFTVEVATAALTLAVKIGDLVRTQW